MDRIAASQTQIIEQVDAESIKPLESPTVGDSGGPYVDTFQIEVLPFLLNFTASSDLENAVGKCGSPIPPLLLLLLLLLESTVYLIFRPTRKSRVTCPTCNGDKTSLLESCDESSVEINPKRHHDYPY